MRCNCTRETANPIIEHFLCTTFDEKSEIRLGVGLANGNPAVAVFKTIAVYLASPSFLAKQLRDSEHTLNGRFFIINFEVDFAGVGVARHYWLHHLGERLSRLLCLRDLAEDARRREKAGRRIGFAKAWPTGTITGSKPSSRSVSIAPREVLTS